MDIFHPIQVIFMLPTGMILPLGVDGAILSITGL
jgi:hypothetical protein